MSGVAVVRYKLANYAGLIALVPATKIMAGVLPVGIVLPAISVMKVSNDPRNTLATIEPGRLYTERVQVTTEAKEPSGYPQLNLIAIQIRAALQNFRGVVNGVTVESIIPDFEGPDLPYPDLSIIAQSQDYMVKWKVS